MIGSKVRKTSADHPMPKQADMLKDAIRNLSNRGDPL
jgi:hypothetical protein